MSSRLSRVREFLDIDIVWIVASGAIILPSLLVFFAHATEAQAPFESAYEVLDGSQPGDLLTDVEEVFLASHEDAGFDAVVTTDEPLPGIVRAQQGSRHCALFTVEDGVVVGEWTCHSLNRMSN